MGVIQEGWRDLGLWSAVAIGLIATFTACYLGMAYRRYGRLSGWSGAMTHTVPIVAAAGVAFVFWPAGGCVGALGAGTDTVGTVVVTLVLGAVAMAVGFLNWHRARRGVVITLLAGGGLGLVAVAARAETSASCVAVVSGNTGDLVGSATPPLIGLLAGVLGGGVGWAVARLVNPLLPRGWSGAVPDWGTPALYRRLLAVGIDFATWWSLATLLTAALRDLGLARPGTVAFVGCAVVLGVVVPQLTVGRATLGRLTVALALCRAEKVAPRTRVLVRCLLLYGPVVALFSLGLPMWGLVVLAVHAAPALVHPERAGLFDLVAGVRSTTRFSVDGRAPTRLVLLRLPVKEEPAASATLAN